MNNFIIKDGVLFFVGFSESLIELKADMLKGILSLVKGVKIFASGSSMGNSVPANAFIPIVKIKNINVDGICLFRHSQGHFSLHRVVDIDGDIFICKGDGEEEKQFVDQKSMIAVMDTDVNLEDKLETFSCFSQLGRYFLQCNIVKSKIESWEIISESISKNMLKNRSLGVPVLFS